MEKLGLPLLVHGEVTDPAIDLFDREAVFIEQVLSPLLKDIPALRVVMEHITTKDAAEFRRWLPPPTSVRRSLRTTCSTTATRSSRAACGPLVLPAGAQARNPPRSTGRAAISGNPKFSSAPIRRRMPGWLGGRLRLRRLLYGECCAGTLCRGLRGSRCARSAGGLRQSFRPRFLPPAAQFRHGHAGEATANVAGGVRLHPGDTPVPLRAGETLAWTFVD